MRIVTPRVHLRSSRTTARFALLMPAAGPRPGKPFADVLRRAREAGYKKAFVENVVLPEWWEHQIAANPAGREEGIGYLALRLGLSPASLREGERATHIPLGEAKYKTREGVTTSDLEPAKAVAAWALRLACGAMPVPLHAVPDAPTLRAHLLSAGAPWVDFPRLLDACWAQGIPVLPIEDPGGGKKMDGMAARFGGRFGVALCGRYRSPSRQAFILAHELGHVACGHLPADGVLVVDEGIAERALGGADGNVRDEIEEPEANGYARDLLMPEFTIYLHPGYSAHKLASWAKEKAPALHIAPGVMVNNYGHVHKKWGVAGAALSDVEGGHNALALMRQALEERLDWDRLSDDEADYLRRLTGLEEPPVK